MNRLTLTDFSLRHPLFVILAVLLVTVLAALQFPNVHFDNDPENMLSEDEFVRLFHHETKQKFGLYDFVIVGIVNEDNPDGIFNVETLQRVDLLTHQLLSLRKGSNGLGEVITDRSGTAWKTVDLNPTSQFKRLMNIAFRHNPNRMFDADGNSAVIGQELMSPSVVDNIKQAGMGSLKLEYLMEHVPTTREEALVIRDDAMNNPLFKGILVSEDSKAVCIYVPISEKSFSYNVAALVTELTKSWTGSDKVHIAGLPVAEDTFGVEMLVQMATSAPLAMLILFIIMLVFFRRIALIIPPLLLAVITVVWSMGLLIGLGFDVHIMSSMIPIFIMPITVCNSIHVLSEFFDSYRRFQNKTTALKHVMHELFMPMLYATITTIAGFASLATTPIPPVRIFGLHVAFGVTAGWLLTMTFVPAFIKMFISEKSLQKLCAVSSGADGCEVNIGLMGRAMRWMGIMTYKRSTAILFITVLVMGFSIFGISLIKVNDNPVKWFTEDHPLRIADTVLNDHFDGTYTAYLTLSGTPNQTKTCREEAAAIRNEAKARFETLLPDATRMFLSDMDQVESNFNRANQSDPNRCFVELTKRAADIDRQFGSSWTNLADGVNYLDSENLTFDILKQKVLAIDGVKKEDSDVLMQKLEPHSSLTGTELLNAALAVCDNFTALSFEEFVYEMKAEVTAPVFKRPEVLNYIERLQENLMQQGKVGKTTSAVDALKKASYELNYSAIEPGMSQQQIEQRDQMNKEFYSIPDSSAAIGQVYIQLEGMKKKDTLFHLVSRDYEEANIWVQLTSGDNQDMNDVVLDVQRFISENPPPVPLNAQWAGLTYLNVVWQEKMVLGMLSSLASSYIVVLVMMLILFRSGWFGLLSMVPLTVTITFIYGLIGWVGKDYDMPVAILSAMTLGLSVDFAIHFLERGREMYKRMGNWMETNAGMFNEPAKAISRNAIVIALGFTPLLLAPLVPYRTVGFFLAMIMLLSWLATLLILPALIRKLENRLFNNKMNASINGTHEKEGVK
ncbi:MMPL family transporter [bacterium]|nr:MMPL family transporter [candidate division CSSED10-310 bacterium]